MKKFLIVAAIALMMMGFDSCQKNKYCQCYAIVDDEDVALGEDLAIGSMTEEQILALDAKYKYNLYIIEHGTCNDKKKEIVGWGNQVSCVEVDPMDPDGSWFERLFNKMFGGSSSNNSNNSNNSGKP